MHVIQEVALITFEALPDSHNLQATDSRSVTATALLYLPAMHSLQTVCPISSLYVPTPQLSHLLVNTLLINPVGHAMHSVWLLQLVCNG